MRICWLPLLLSLSLANCASHHEDVTIVIPGDHSALEQLAAKEMRRILFQRTDQLIDIVKSDTLPAEDDLIVLGEQSQPLMAEAAHFRAQEYRLETVREAGRKVLFITGGDAAGVLYGAYRCAEHLGVRFYLHGDVIPDEKIPLCLPTLHERRAPLFEVRGIHPFHDFPEGPDWWNLDDYKAILAQLPKMGMNFFALHTYPENQPIYGEEKGPEPTVWIGLECDINPDGTVKFSSPARHFTTRTNTWGYQSMNTGDYHLGASQLFERDDYGANYMQGRTPWPAIADRNDLFNECGNLLGDAFAFAHQLRIKTCVGTELTLTIPEVVRHRLLTFGKDPADPATVREVYEGMFRWIEKNYPLDYYWLWTHEGWTWSDITDEEVARTEADLLIAYDALQNVGKPFTLATCGWVLGPPQDRTQFDRLLAHDVVFSAINRELGKERIDRHFAAIHDRPTWAIPWLEDDPRLISPQLWAGRMRQDAADALAYGCDGLLGIHWRTRMLEPTVSSLATAAWEQRWATAKTPPQFGERDVIAYATGAAVTLPDLQPPFATVREGASAYFFQLPNGLYTVKIFFIEPSFADRGKRVFSIRLQGDRPIEFYDIAASVGKGMPAELTFANIRVTDNMLIVDFTAVVGSPCVAGFHIEGEGQSHKLDCGAAIDHGDWLAESTPLPPLPRGMPIDDFYLDWAKANFGDLACQRIADIFTSLDGHLPEPAQWIDGPGGIQTVYVPWDQMKSQYAFVEALQAVRPQVKGAGNLERFDYWLNSFKFMRSIARVGCTLGELEKIDAAIQSDSSGQRLAKEQMLPVRLRLTAEWSDMLTHLLSYADTPGDLGTIANIEQHNWLALNLLHKHDERLQRWLGEDLPQSACLAKDYRGKTRMIVPTKRTILELQEDFNLKILVLSPSATRAPVFNFKFLGHTEFQRLEAEHIARGVYNVRLTADEIKGNDFEYFVTLPGEEARFPATSPNINHVVLICGK
ncbi:hypothetical protein JW998_12730 [candidate division KSB1 bacterium]|nr:hypothetical protein [candidate division KSB1 bacterium]